MIRLRKQFYFICIISVLITNCVPQSVAETKVTLPATPSVSIETPAPQPTAGTSPQVVEPTQPPVLINPLTGLHVQDSALLELPAVLVSIANFPAIARPQAGLSFASFVYEVYITAGGTRFLAAFYGGFPEPELIFDGGCALRNEPFEQTDRILGNRVWLDSNQNHMQDEWERGIGGVCINLHDANNNLLQQTTTDSNGYYGFNVIAGNYFIEVLKPGGMEFSRRDAGDENQDSDVDQATGRSDAVEISSTRLDLDAGLILSDQQTPSSNPVPARVGPVRSGRLVYGDIAKFYANSCLIYAYASSEVLVELPFCAYADHILQGAGYMFDIEKMRQLAEERRSPEIRRYYQGNIFSADVPEGGTPAARLHVFFAWLNQAAWVFDPASQTWWRYVDDGDPNTAGILHPEVDRLNKRQLQFENVIVLFAKHDVISPTNLQIHLEQDWVGDALLFRDGMMHKIRWSTRASDEEIRSGIRKPMLFYYPDETTLFPLKPGRTWVVVVTPNTAVTEKGDDNWFLRFVQPLGAK